MIFAVHQKAWFVLFMGVGVPCESPPVFVSEVAKPAKMRGNTSHSLDPLLARLARRWGTSFSQKWFGVSVDIAESAVEADINPRELVRVMLIGVVENPLLYTLPNR